MSARIKEAHIAWTGTHTGTQGAIQIAQSVHGSTNKNVWNNGAWPTNSPDVINQTEYLRQISSFSDLYRYVKKTPVYGYYNNGLPGADLNSAAHLVVITGVISAPNHPDLIISNNPWGKKNVQTYSDFTNSIPGDNSNPSMTFRSILRVK